MTKVLILGHGGYASALKRHLDMLIGTPSTYFFVDFDESDDIEILRGKMSEVILQMGESDILFACDIMGGTPFRESCEYCATHKNCAVVAGLNTSAYSEMSFNLQKKPAELAKFACETTKESLLVFVADE